MFLSFPPVLYVIIFLQMVQLGVSLPGVSEKIVPICFFISRAKANLRNPHVFFSSFKGKMIFDINCHGKVLPAEAMDFLNECRSSVIYFKKTQTTKPENKTNTPLALVWLN